MHELYGIVDQVRHRNPVELQPERRRVQAVADQAVVHQGREAPAGTPDLGGPLQLGVDVGGRKGQLLRGRAVHHGQRRAEFMVDHVEELALLQPQGAFAVQRGLQRVLCMQQLGRACAYPAFERVLGAGQ